MSTVKNILRQFQGLSPDQIAAVIQRRGIKGRMGTTYKCPMALLLTGESTGQYVVGRKFIARRSNNKIEKTTTPLNMAQFLRKFDIGGYPKLIAPPPRCTAQAGDKPRSGGPRTKRGKRGPIKHHIAKLVHRFEEVGK